MEDRDVMELMYMVDGNYIELKKVGIFKRTIYPIRCLIIRLWRIIGQKSGRSIHGYEKGDIVHFKGASGVNDGYYEIVDSTKR